MNATDLMSLICLSLLSSFFLLIGVALFYLNRLYSKHGKRISGKVVGIEKYISRYKSNNQVSTSLVYRPIIECFYEGQKVYFCGSSGSSQIYHEVGEKVLVEYIVNKPESIRLVARSIYKILHLMLFAISISLIYFTASSRSPIFVNTLRVVLPFVFLTLLYHMAKVKMIKYGGIDNYFIQNSLLKTKDELNKLDIFWSNDQILKEETRVYKPFLYILPLLLGLAIWPIVVFLPKFLARTYVKSNLSLELMEIDKLKLFFSEIMRHSQMQKEFIIIGASSFFIICLVISFIGTLRKLKK